MRGWLIAAAMAAAVAAGGGCLEVDAPDGLLQCSPVPGRACPEGYYCEQGSMTCWRLGESPDLAGFFNYPYRADLAYQQFGPFVQDMSKGHD